MKDKATRYEKRCMLPCEVIICIAQDIIEEYELPDIPERSIRDACNTGLAVFVHNGNGCIWVDGEYIAWEPAGQDICYAYVTRNHIHSERRSFQDVGRQRHETVRLPNDIEAAFRRAEKEMSRLDDFWVDGFYRELLNISIEKRS